MLTAYGVLIGYKKRNIVNNKTNEKGAKKMKRTGLVTLGAVYIYIYISRLLEKENNKINMKNIDNQRMIKPIIGKI